MIQIGDRVQVGFGDISSMAWAMVTEILPAVGDRIAMYRVKFESDSSQRWVDDGVIYGPFLDQSYGWD